jgi:hypothetical protein
VLLAYIGISEFRKYQHRAHRDQFVGELRTLAAAFESHHAQHGVWPAGTNAESRLPKGMEAALAKTRWLAGPPFGGSYDWIPLGQTPPRAATPPAKQGDDAPKSASPGGLIAVTAFSPLSPLALSRRDLLYVDGKLDDGNLSTGRFRTGFNGWPVLQVSSNR